jgi:hypothetical protein
VALHSMNFFLMSNRKNIAKIIEDNREWIVFNLKWHTIYWIGQQLGIDKVTMHRHAIKNNWKGKDMREALSIDWQPTMIDTLHEKFSTSFNSDLAKELGVSIRTMLRKARALNLEKETGFLKKRRPIITAMAKAARPKNNQQTIERITEAGKPYRFKKGNIPPTTLPPDIREAQHLITVLNRKINNHEKHNNRLTQSPVSTN